MNDTTADFVTALSLMISTTGYTTIQSPRRTDHVHHRKHSENKVEKKALLKLLRGKLEGNHTAGELEEPLEYNSHCKSSAVLVATSEIDINGVKVTKLASKLLAKQAGLSLDALSHCTCPQPKVSTSPLELMNNTFMSLRVSN